MNLCLVILFLIGIGNIGCIQIKVEEPLFKLYTKNNNSTYFVTTPFNFKSSEFLITRERTAFIVHGFKSSGDETWVKNIKDGLLKREDCNVFAVDWSETAKQVAIEYGFVAKTVGDIGNFIADFIVKLGIPPKNVHCIGHSLGAHVCSGVGKKIKLGRISGLDPAGPEFKSALVFNITSLSLSVDDADFVDVMHTSMTYGYSKNLGHVDFYPNGGYYQPDCIFSSQLPRGVCSHSLATKWFADSLITEDKFVAQQCNSYDDYQMFLKNPNSKLCKCCGYMGFDATKSSFNGSYFLNVGGGLFSRFVHKFF